MENVFFDKVFKERMESIRLSIDSHDSFDGNRIGGYAPVFFDDLIINRNQLGDYYYYFTINSELLPIKDDLEISVFYPKEFKLYNRNNKYPDFPIKCIFHKKSSRGNSKLVYNEFMQSKSIISLGLKKDLEEMESVDDDDIDVEFAPAYGSKIGGNPSFLQDETSYVERLNEDNYVFILQFDESSYLRDQVTGNEPFNHGIVYFYGKIENNILIDLAGGFWQN